VPDALTPALAAAVKGLAPPVNTSNGRKATPFLHKVHNGRKETHMTALLIARINVLNPEHMQAYGAAAGPTVAAHRGEFIARGKLSASLLGDESAQAVAIIRFPSVDAANGWFASPEYQALAELRTAAAEMQFTLYAAA